MTTATDRIPDHCYRFFDSGESRTVVAPIIWKEISTAFEGRPIGGSWLIENGIVKVKTTLGEKTAPLEEANGT